MVKLPLAAKQATIDQQRLNSLINSMADGVLATDEAGKVVLYNGAALDVLDVNGDIKGRTLAQIMKLTDKDAQPVDIMRLVLGTKTQSVTRDYKLGYPDSSTISLYLSIAPVHLGYGGDNGQKGYVLLLRDITREKSLEEERDEFISVVSHELRTPIAIAEGNIGNALFIAGKAAQQDPAVLDALKQAHDQTTFLAGMINDLSTLSRAERGKLAVEVEPINAHDLVQDLAKNYLADAQAKKLQLLTQISPDLELLHSSPLYVREVLQNFITNAIKYTETGSVTIGARPRQNAVEFFVQDTGIGVSKADKERLFDKFFRSEDYRTRQNSGTGLGLYVTLKLARLLHAQIDVQSQLNHGSVFTVLVPNLQVSPAPVDSKGQVG